MSENKIIYTGNMKQVCDIIGEKVENLNVIPDMFMRGIAIEDIEEIDGVFKSRHPDTWIMEISHNYITRKCVLFKERDTWYSNLKMYQFHAFLSGNVPHIMPPRCLIPYKEEMFLCQPKCLYALVALLYKQSYPIRIMTRDDGMLTIMQESGIITIEGDHGTSVINPKESNCCHYDAEYLLKLIIQLIPIEYHAYNYSTEYIYPHYDRVCYTSPTQNNGIEVDVAGDISLLYHPKYFLFSNAEESVLRHGESCEELIDMYVASFNDGEFSKHIADMLRDLKIQRKVLDYLKEKLESE